MLNTVRAFAIRWLLEPIKKSEGITLIIRKTDGKGNFVPGAGLYINLYNNTNADKLKVAGAEIDYLYVGGSSSTLGIVTKSEIITISGVLPGNYVISEHNTPSGYINADSVSFSLLEDGTIKRYSTSETVIIDGYNFEIINTPIAPVAKHTIKFLAAWIDAPDTPYPSEGSTQCDVYTNYEHDNIVEICHTASDMITAKASSKMLGIKIYEDDVYIGGFGVVCLDYAAAKIVSVPEGVRQEENIIVCTHDYDIAPGHAVYAQSSEIHGYTMLSEPAEKTKQFYIAKGLSDPNPEMLFTGGTRTPVPGSNYFGLSIAVFNSFAHHSENYEYAQTYDYVRKSESVITGSSVEYRSPTEIVVGAECTRNITEIWTNVNMKLKEGGMVSGPEIYTESRTENKSWLFNVIGPDQLPDIKYAAPELTVDAYGNVTAVSGLGYYMHYIDGMNPELLAECAGKATKNADYTLITGVEEIKED